MNKDKEWAKIKIHEELDSWQNIEGGIDGDGIKYVLNIIDQIDEPESLTQELPVIPKFVAEWIEGNRGHYENIFLIGYDLYDNTINPAVDDWIEDNEEKFIRAWFDGFTVEEEPKFYVSERDEEYGGFGSCLKTITVIFR